MRYALQEAKVGVGRLNEMARCQCYPVSRPLLSRTTTQFSTNVIAGGHVLVFISTIPFSTDSI